MNDKVKQVVPELNFNNKSRLIMLTVGKFDQGFVVRNVIPKKTVALTSMGDIMSMAAQIAEAIFDTVKVLLEENKAITINLQVLDKQVGVIPLGFDQISDQNMLGRLITSLQPLLRVGGAGQTRSTGFKDVFSDIEENNSNKPLVFDPTLLGFNQIYPGMDNQQSPFFFIREDDPRVIPDTQSQKGPLKQKNTDDVKETRDGNTVRLEG